MNSQIVILLVVIAAIVVAAAIFLAARKRRSQNLREQFGPEYDRVVRKEGDVHKGNAHSNSGKSIGELWKFDRSRQPTTRGSAVAGSKCKVNLWITLPMQSRWRMDSSPR
jgi:hypothetical protein